MYLAPAAFQTWDGCAWGKVCCQTHRLAVRAYALSILHRGIPPPTERYLVLAAGWPWFMSNMVWLRWWRVEQGLLPCGQYLSIPIEAIATLGRYANTTQCRLVKIDRREGVGEKGRQRWSSIFGAGSDPTAVEPYNRTNEERMVELAHPLWLFEHITCSRWGCGDGEPIYSMCPVVVRIRIELSLLCRIWRYMLRLLPLPLRCCCYYNFVAAPGDVAIDVADVRISCGIR